MKKKNVEQLAAETILERGIRVNVPSPRFFKLFGKKEVGLVIKQPYLGTLMHMSRLCLKAGFNLDDVDEGKVDAAFGLMEKHGRTVAKIVAVIILNSKFKIRLFSNILSYWLLWKMKPRKLVEMVILLITLSGVQDFTTSIRLIRRMKTTTPKNLSPMEQGSQQAEQ